MVWRRDNHLLPERICTRVHREQNRPMTVDEAISQKLFALRRLMDIFCLPDRRPGAPPLFSPKTIVLLICGVCATDRLWWQRSACAALLNYGWPEWRQHVDPKILGYVLERRDIEVLRWRRIVLERDNHECQKCGDEDNLHVHHIVRWIDAPELRIIVANGVTLCAECHKKAHRGSKLEPITR